jgi:hypothetical protein
MRRARVIEKPTLAQLAKHNESMRRIGLLIRAENIAYREKMRAEEAASSTELTKPAVMSKGICPCP